MENTLKQARIIQGGCAFFGLVVCLLGTLLDGTLYTQPVYWLNALPALCFFAYSAATFPNIETLTRVRAGS